MRTLDLDPQRDRDPTPPRAAATVLVLRDGDAGLEVFCIVRHPKSGFLGGVVAFPGGKVDADDLDERWASRTTAVHSALTTMADLPAPPRALAVAAAREALEEAAIVPVTGALDDAAARALRAACEAGRSLADELDARGLLLDASALVPFARWVTPTAEARRFDALFFLLAVPPGQVGSFDGRETTSGFWATPADVLARWERDELSMAPPTTRCLEILATVSRVQDALELATAQSLLPICPSFVTDSSGSFLALPGDPAHEVAERRVTGSTRFVLEGARFVGREPA